MPARIIAEREAQSCLKPALENEAFDSTLDGFERARGLTAYLDFLSACERELNVPEQEYPIFLALHRVLHQTRHPDGANGVQGNTSYLVAKS
jgi:hypothetical protein